MKKITKILTAITITAGMAGAVFASCPVNSSMCVSDLLKTSPAVQNNSFMNNTNSFPSIEINPTPSIREEVNRNYNFIQNNTVPYDANCQFGVCLPSGQGVNSGRSF